MMEKLQLPQPRKVQLQSFSPASSEGMAGSSISTPPPLQFPSSNTVIIFNWDSALLCTSWLSWHAEQYPSAELDKYLRKIAQRTQSMLEVALKMGHTYIISSFVSGWVEETAAVWLPELLPLLHRLT